MGDRDYYLVEDDASVKCAMRINNSSASCSRLTGASPEQAEAAVNAVMKIETGIAKSSFSREDLRDSQKEL